MSHLAEYDTDERHGECLIASCEAMEIVLELHPDFDVYVASWYRHKWGATNAILAGSAEREILPISTFPFQQWGWAREHHVLVVEGVIYDFTARQFDPELPFPYIMEVPK
jgi:hypothetical protein